MLCAICKQEKKENPYRLNNKLVCGSCFEETFRHQRTEALDAIMDAAPTRGRDVERCDGCGHLFRTRALDPNFLCFVCRRKALEDG